MVSNLYSGFVFYYISPRVSKTTRRNLFWILLIETKFGLKLNFSDWFHLIIPNVIPYGAKSIRKVLLESKFAV